jgi:VIT1/CCC1 family predicted Fe2+/Mn2+ transporter
MSRLHTESHLVERVGWLRASVLGANDGIVSTASLIVGVASAGQSQGAILVTAMAGLVAGAMSMAAGEYVSVSSQSDTEQADRAREVAELASQPEAEREELIGIYEGRGLDRALATQVADQLMAKDALTAHLRDELGLSESLAAKPVQAALSSAAAFSVGAVLPLAIVPLVPDTALIWTVTLSSLLFLALLGGVGAKVGGANVGRAVIRVTFWGAMAMAATAAIGALFGTAVA